MGLVEVTLVQAEENAMKAMMVNAMKQVVAESRPEFFLEEAVLNVKEAAKFCDMSVGSFNNQVRDGRIVPHRPDGRPKFLKSELIEFIKRS